MLDTFKVVLIYSNSESKDGKKASLMIITLYVDDILLATNDVHMLKEEKAKLKQQLEMEDQGEVHYCLGMSIKECLPLTKRRTSKIC